MSCTALDYRRAESDAARTEVFDIVIIGAGITGACLFHQLRKKGFRVLLADKSDFAGGTSQASAMMLWGGLAYLRSFDLPTVARLSSSREALVRGMHDYARPRTNRYLVPSPKTGNRAIVQSALYVYWLLGRFRRARPRLVEDFRELSLLKDEVRNCYEYEEAYLPDSDARFVLQWILRARDAANPALNYCHIREGHYDAQRGQWMLDVEDSILREPFTIRTKLVVNAAGVWADRLNENFAIETPYKHVLSKGVFIGLRRDPSHETPLIVEKDDQDCYALIPWGPVALWGPTETLTPTPEEGFAVTSDDIQLLAEEYDKHFSRPFGPEDVVSLRCGVRGLAVPRSGHQGRPQNLSRKYVVHRDRDLPWITIHGGKLTSCVSIANSAVNVIDQSLKPSLHPLQPGKAAMAEPDLESFPGLTEKVPSAAWSANESCWFLQDYLRRRTNISQWVPRGGLGHFDENAAHLALLAKAFAFGDAASYQRDIEMKYDRVLMESSLMNAPEPWESSLMNAPVEVL